MADFERTVNLQWLKKFDAIAGSAWNYMDYETLNGFWLTLDRFRKHRIRCWVRGHLSVDVELYAHDALYYIWNQCKSKGKSIPSLWRRVFYSLSEENKELVLEFIKHETENSQIGA